MEIELLFQGSYSIAKIGLKSGETIKAQSDAMVSMTSNISVEGKAEGGVLGVISRSLSGESLFYQTLKCNDDKPGEVTVAPYELGDLAILELDESKKYIIRKGSFLVGEEGITLENVSQGLMKGLFSGQGFVLQKVSGNGKIVISSFGGIIKRTLAPDETWIVDNGHMVAWSDTVQYDLKKSSSGMISSLTSGEGIVCECKGPGDIYIQSRNPSGFASWLRMFLITN